MPAFPTSGVRTIVAAAFLCCAGNAIAADAVVEPIDEAVPLMTSVYDWSGAYLGLQAGYGWAHADVAVATVPPTGETYDLDGFFGGVLAGYNLQFGNVVVGIEGDINASAIELDENGAELDLDRFGSLRGRLGFAFDRTLAFGTAGIAFAHVVPGGGDADVDFTGWTAGVGVERAFTENWLGRAEYRYYDFAKEDITRGTVELDMHTLSL